MKKNKIIISLVLIIIAILLTSAKSFAADFNLNVFFNGKEIRMESETPDMSWNIENFLPGNSDKSSIVISNAGERKATVETGISIEEDTGLLDMIDLEIKNKADEVVYTGKYTDLKTVSKILEPGENETYTVETKLNINAGNEYQNKQYKLKFNFKAIGEIPNGILTVKYVDENNEQLQEDEITTKKIGNTYELPSNGKEFQDYELERVEGNLTGEYVENGTTVVYHYKKIKYGNLIVKYIDEEENELEKNSTIKRVGDNYELPDTGKIFEGYDFIGIDGETKGKYKEEDTIVKYKYKKIVRGNLNLKFVDEQGYILDTQTTIEKIGTPYTVDSIGKEISGYKFKEVRGILSGEYTEQDINIIYIYEKLEEKKSGNVIIRYIDQDGNKIRPDDIKTDEVGNQYEVNSNGAIIDGYDFLTVEGDYVGIYSEKDIIVTYKYKKRERSKVIITYVDEENNVLQENITTDLVGNPFSFSEEQVKVKIPGYDFKKVEGSLSGEYKKEDTIIYCRYEKNKYGNVILVSIDENNAILQRNVITNKVGENYDFGSVGEKIEGYKFLGVEGETSGQYKTEDTIITYKYEKEKNSGIITDKVTLPQTGENRQPFFIVIGAIVVIVILLYIGKKRLNSK